MSFAKNDALDKLTARLTEVYFSDPERTLTLSPGQVLGRRGEHNRRLYFVKAGRLRGQLANETGTHAESFYFDSGELIGVHSFFSRQFIMAFTVTAETDSSLAYIDRDHPPARINETQNIDEQFMPIVVESLMRRQLLIHKMAEKQQQVMNRMREVEKLASLGQLSAGVAHELNNALTVLSLGSRWISDYLKEEMSHRGGMETVFFDTGLAGGRKLSTAEIRDRQQTISRLFKKLSPQVANMLARTGIAPEVLKALPEAVIRKTEALHELWELGATLNDMRLASSQAEHVITSMKTLGAPNSEREPGIDVNESIRVALSLTRNDSKGKTIDQKLGELPTVYGNIGELVQIWTNLVRNACEAMTGAGTPEPTVTITSWYEPDKRRVGVRVADNGPGIPEDLLPHIFQPNVTTRKRGLAFGLGLGLTIAHRLITDYHGAIEVKSSDRGAEFTVYLPAEKRNGSS